MKATNSLAPNSGKKQTFSVAIQGNALQGLIRASVPTAADAARLTGTLISAVAGNEQLKQCEPASIVAAALRGEGMKLTYGVDYHLVPYRDKAAYIIGYKGLLHLLIATGEVADTNCIEVLEGEYIGRNKRTKRPEFDFSKYETEEDEQGHPVIGYYFFVELKNGYIASEYMRVGDILAHAQRYSQTFDRETYDKLQRGEYSAQEAERIKGKSPWYGSTETMMKKTVIRKLLNSGFVPLANSADLRKALDEDGETGEGEIISADLLPGDNGEVVVMETTGEVVDPEKTAQEPLQGPSAASDDKLPTENPKKAPGLPRKAESTAQDTPYESVDDFNAAFFGGNAQ